MSEYIYDYLRTRAENTPSRVFTYFIENGLEKIITCGEVWRESINTGSFLQREGVRAGDIVVIAHPHSSQLYSSFLGAQLCGAIPTFMPFPNKKQDSDLYWKSHHELFERIRPKAVIASAEYLSTLASVWNPANTLLTSIKDLIEEDLDSIRIVDNPIALLQHSSGTTGGKKGVVLTHEKVIRQVEAYAKVLDLDSESNIVSWLPLYHDMGLIACFMLPVITGTALVSIDAFEWTTKPGILLELISKYQSTHTWLPNFAFNHMVRTANSRWEGDLSSMKAFINCSEPCKATSFEKFVSVFSKNGLRPEMLQCCYAMAETVFAVTATELGKKPRAVRIEREPFQQSGIARETESSEDVLEFLSVGQPIEILQVGILNEVGEELGEGRAGEIAVKGECLFEGYYLNPNSTIDEHGWYRTGDIGFSLDRELFISGRVKELIIVNGKNFFANDIEEVTSLVPGVKPGRSVAFGLYNDELGSEQVVVLLETLVEPENLSLFQALVRKMIFDALSLNVAKVILVPQNWLIKTTSGKFSRALNKEKFLTKIGTSAT